AKELNSRKLSVSFSSAKGEVKDEMIQATLQFQQIGAALAELTEKTKDAVTNAMISFKKADERASKNISLQ
ncbi:MAG: hypothetical protein Q4G07_09195, partial [Oscillospiraceae bacterium]|nr:hypothetical protein [Oscillospiraceae bacterium]